MFNRIWQTISDSRLNVYWDGFGYNNYSVRLSNVSLNNLVVNLEAHTKRLLTAGTWLLCLDNVMAEGQTYTVGAGSTYYDDYSGYKSARQIGFSSLDEKDKYIIAQIHSDLVPFYPRLIAAQCHVKYDASKQSQYAMKIVDQYGRPDWVYKWLAQSIYSGNFCENGWVYVEATLCGHEQNTVNIEIENCLMRVMHETITQAHLLCDDNKAASRSAIVDCLVYALPVVGVCTAGYLAYSFFSKRNAAVPAPVAAVPVPVDDVDPGQEDDAPTPR